MDIRPIRTLIVFLLFFIFAYSSYAITYEAVRSRTLTLDRFVNVGASIYESECSTSRTAFAVCAALNYFRYNRGPSMEDLHRLRFWTDRPWPSVPTMDYEINGINISDMKVQSFHFSVKSPAVNSELSIFLLSFFSQGKFMFALYFNENMGKVGCSFQDVVGCNLLLRRIPEFPYLNEKEVDIQQVFLDGMRWGTNTYPRSTEKSRLPENNRTISTNDIEVIVDCL